MTKKCSLDPSNNRIVSNTNILIYSHGIGFFTELRVVVIIVQNVNVDRCSENRENIIILVFFVETFFIILFTLFY